MLGLGTRLGDWWVMVGALLHKESANERVMWLKRRELVRRGLSGVLGRDGGRKGWQWGSWMAKERHSEAHVVCVNLFYCRCCDTDTLAINSHVTTIKPSSTGRWVMGNQGRNEGRRQERKSMFLFLSFPTRCRYFLLIFQMSSWFSRMLLPNPVTHTHTHTRHLEDMIQNKTKRWRK